MTTDFQDPVAQTHFFWLKSKDRESLRRSLGTDLQSRNLSAVDLENLEMMILATIRRISTAHKASRIDIRPLTRARDIGLEELRWNVGIKNQNLVLRLFFQNQTSASSKLGIRFFDKPILNQLGPINAAQDRAIDDAARILSKFGRQTNYLRIA
jgi:hypothetical protein